MIISLIVAASENDVIGHNGTLPWHLPDDLARFKAITTGHDVIMGRRTWESTGGSPLPGRRNIVVTSRSPVDLPGASVVGDLDAALATAEGDEVFVLGGTRIFEDALPRAQRIHLTRVHATVEGDTLFPGFSQDAWTRTAAERHEVDERHRHAFTFETWERSEA